MADQIDIKQASNLLQLILDGDRLLAAASEGLRTHYKLPSTT